MLSIYLIIDELYNLPTYEYTPMWFVYQFEVNLILCCVILGNNVSDYLIRDNGLSTNFVDFAPNFKWIFWTGFAIDIYHIPLISPILSVQNIIEH